MTVTAAAFRKAIGEFVTGVAVVTVAGPDSDPVGVTVDSFARVSVDPPIVSVGLERESPAHERLTGEDGTDGLCVNVLTTGQRDLAKHFADTETLSRDPFETRPTGVGPTGVPAFERSLAAIECRTRSRIPAGDHAVWLCRVVNVARPERGADPLTFARGDWGTVECEPCRPARGRDGSG